MSGLNEAGRRAASGKDGMSAARQRRTSAKDTRSRCDLGRARWTLAVGRRRRCAVAALHKRGRWCLERDGSGTSNERRPFDPLRMHLLDELIGKREQCRWHGEAKHLRRFQIDHQFELGRLLDGQFRRLGPLQDFINEHGGLSEL